MKKYISLILLVFLLGNKTNCIAQTQRIDSLKKIGYSNLNVEKRLEAILLLLQEADSMPSEEWQKILNDAETLLKQTNSPSGNCTFVFSKSRFLILKGKIDSAAYLTSTTLEKYKNVNNIKPELLLLEYRLAAIPIDEGKYKEGIEAMLPILNKAEEQKNKMVWCYACNSIGLSYMVMGRYEDAIPWFKKLARLKVLPNEQINYAKVLNNLASCLNNVKQYDSATFYIDKGIERAKAEQNLKSIANGYSIKADIVINIGQNEKAEELMMQAIEIRKKIGNPDFVASDMAQLSIYYSTVGQYEKGINIAKEALQIFNDNKLTAKTMFAYEALKANYKNKGDIKNHALVLEKMLALKDSLYSANSAEALTELQQKFEVEKKEKIISQQQLDLVKRNILLYGALLGILLILSFLGYQFKKYQKKQKLIAEQKRIQNEINVKEAEEKERKRIAAELHDNLGVQANAILHNSTLLNVENRNNKLLVEDLQDTAKEMLLNLRETLWAMKTADVTANDLWLRIINFMKQMGRHYSTVNFVVDGIPPSNLIVPSTKALNIVLVIQETVNNAVKHAQAKTISVKSVITNNNWQLTIEDDGKGFEIEEARQKSSGYGLSNMQERAKNGGFAYSIKSEINKGTTAIIDIKK